MKVHFSQLSVSSPKSETATGTNPWQSAGSEVFLEIHYPHDHFPLPTKHTFMSQLLPAVNPMASTHTPPLPKFKTHLLKDIRRGLANEGKNRFAPSSHKRRTGIRERGMRQVRWLGFSVTHWAGSRALQKDLYSHPYLHTPPRIWIQKPKPPCTSSRN